MDKQKAVIVEADGSVRIADDYEIAPLHDYECRAKVISCAFCNATDFDIIQGKLHGLTPDLYPVVLGHEGACEVIEIGPKVRHIKLGDRFMSPYNYDTDKYNSSYGNFTQYAVVCDYKAMEEDGNLDLLKQYPFYGQVSLGSKPIDPSIDFYTISVMRPMCECLSAVTNFGITPEMDIMIYGAGPMGIGFATFAALKGVRSMVIVDLSEERLKIAKELVPSAEIICTANRSLKDQLGMRTFDAVVDIVGNSKLLIEGSSFLRPYGTACSMGVLKGEDSIFDVLQLQNNTKLHILNFPYHEYGAFDFVVEQLLKGTIDPKNWYSHVLPIRQIKEGMEMIRSKEAFKIVFDMTDF